MKNITERINYILQHYNLTAGDFAKKLNIQKSSISHLLSGRNKPSFQFLSKLNKVFPEIDLNWFVSGEGDIFKNSKTNTKYDNLKEDKNIITPEETEKTMKIKSEKKTDNKSLNPNQVENIILIYQNDTFKILKKS